MSIFITIFLASLVIVAALVAIAVLLWLAIVGALSVVMWVLDRMINLNITRTDTVSTDEG